MTNSSKNIQKTSKGSNKNTKNIQILLRRVLDEYTLTQFFEEEMKFLKTLVGAAIFKKIFLGS